MDSNVATAARRLGLAPATVHHALDDMGLPRTGRGRARRVTDAHLARLTDRCGAVPVLPDGMHRRDMLALAALARAPRGLPSARAVARIARMSPTSASSALAALTARGLTRTVVRSVTAAGRATARRYTVPAWPLPVTVAHAVHVVTLPEGLPQPATGRLPASLYQHFWDADPRRLRVIDDGIYMAARLLGSDDPSAPGWVLQNIARLDVDAATRMRGTTPRVKALVDNWYRHAAAA